MLENKQWGEVVRQQNSVPNYHQLSLQNKQWGEVVMQKSSEPGYHETIFREPQCPILGFHCFCFYLGFCPWTPPTVLRFKWKWMSQNYAILGLSMSTTNLVKTHKKKESKESIFFAPTIPSFERVLRKHIDRLLP